MKQDSSLSDLIVIVYFTLRELNVHVVFDSTDV